MNRLAATQCVTAVSLVLVTGIGAWAAEEQKPSATFKSLIDRALGKGEGRTDGGGETPGKEITKVSRYASVVLDRNCPEIVQPYKLTDNVTALGIFSVKEGLSSLTNRILAGRSVSKDDAVPASTKRAAKQLNWLPMSAEVEYGERLHAEVLDDVLPTDGRLGKTHYPTATGMLKEILAAISEKHEYDFRLFILKRSGHNAVARPGGFLYIDEGLIKDPALQPKAYFALAHEVAHVLQRHETKELQSIVVDSVPTKSELVKIVSGVTRTPGAILAHVKAEKNLFTRHHIDQELQADSCAARLLSRVLPDAQALADSLNAFLRDLPPPEPVAPRPVAQTQADKLAETVSDIVDTPMRRHPTSEERFQNLKAIYGEVLKDKAAGK
jgi:hypothetical protein